MPRTPAHPETVTSSTGVSPLVLLQLSISNILAHKARNLAAGAGICFAIFLIILQWGLLLAAKKESTLLYEYFDFDLALVSEGYQFMYSAKGFDRIRLIQARALPVVDDTFSLSIGKADWVDPDTDLRSATMVVGIDPKAEFITDPLIRDELARLRSNRDLLVDRLSQPDLGPLERGRRARLNRQEVEIAGFFELGFFFYAEGSVLVKNEVFPRYTGRGARDITVGMIRLRPGADPQAAQRRLTALLPGEVVVMTRSQLIDQEQAYFVDIKPLGIMFQSGVLVAFLTGLVVLFQVTSTDVGTRLKEYATLKAMGFGGAAVYGTALGQILMLSLAAFLPAVGISAWLFHLVRELTHLPLELSPQLLSLVLALTLGMNLLAGVTTLSRLSRAHPADLF